MGTWFDIGHEMLKNIRCCPEDKCGACLRSVGLVENSLKEIAANIQSLEERDKLLEQQLKEIKNYLDKNYNWNKADTVFEWMTNALEEMDEKRGMDCGRVEELEQQLATLKKEHALMLNTLRRAFNQSHGKEPMHGDIGECLAKLEEMEKGE